MHSVESGQDVMNHQTTSGPPRGSIGLRVGSETKPAQTVHEVNWISSPPPALLEETLRSVVSLLLKESGLEVSSIERLLSWP